MQTIPTALAGVLILEPRVFGDARGFFMESFNRRVFEQLTGAHADFVQDNHSRSAKGVLRGLHYQIRQPQGKLVRVVRGAVFDVAVDLRRSSPTFGRWVGAELTEDNHRQLWVPPGLAHGFVVLSDSADFLYKTTDYYAPEHERCIAWDDPAIGIDWPLAAHGIADHLVEVGGELRARGTRPGGQPWRVAVAGPGEGGQTVLALREQAVATSGDHWHAFEHGGRRYSHTIDPRSGEPVRHALAAVTVLHAECMHADALATVLTVLGPCEGFEFAQAHGIAARFCERAESGAVLRATPAFEAATAR